MMRKLLLFLLLSFIFHVGQAQLDRYKYIVVPLQFDGFKQVNQFRTSTQIKQLFTQNGFTTIYDNEIPPELAAKPCQGLRVVLIDNSSLLATKVKLGLQDCYGQVVYETLEGKSKVKDYELAYREAITDAFVVIPALGYSYSPGETETGGAVAAAGTMSPIESSESQMTDTAPAVSPEKAAITAAVVPEVVAEKEASELWYAQPIENGYQLVDSTPTVRMKLLTTSQKDTYIAMVAGAPNGMVYRKDGAWWHEFYEDGKASLQKLNLKF
ncbi:MAG: hypothetical protein P8X60_09565 [Robiginitalea sp.]|jgi:hypothetical protein